MNPSTLDPGLVPPPPLMPTGESAPAVSWGAIVAGGAAAAALSLILLVLGAGLGFGAMSPWAQNGASAQAFGVSTIVWLALTAIFASGLGGYLAGRLRTRWDGTHVDEVHFRDTAHGLLTWAVATLLTAGVLTSAIGTIVGGGVEAGAHLGGAAVGAAGAAGAAAGRDDGLGYFTDSLFRRDGPSDGGAASPAPSATGQSATAPSTSAPSTTEVTRIFVQDLKSGALSPEDTHYVGQLVAQRTGLAQADAEKRVGDTFARAKAAADDAANKARKVAEQARRAAAHAAFWLFVTLLAGAFSATLFATFGGRQRDA